MIILYLLVALIGAAGAIFALQNIDPVVIRFLGWRIEGAPLALVLMLSMIMGIVLTSLVGIVQQWKLKSKIRQLQARLAQVSAATEANPADPGPLSK